MSRLLSMVLAGREGESDSHGYAADHSPSGYAPKGSLGGGYHSTFCIDAWSSLWPNSWQKATREGRVDFVSRSRGIRSTMTKKVWHWEQLAAWSMSLLSSQKPNKQTGSNFLLLPPFLFSPRIGATNIQGRSPLLSSSWFLTRNNQIHPKACFINTVDTF